MLQNDEQHRFAEYVRRGLRFLLHQVQDTPGVLGDETREQALALLNLSLPVGGVWTQARDLLLTSAPKMEQAGIRDEWFPFLEAGLRQSEQLHDRSTAAELHFQLGLLHRLRSNFTESVRRLERALADFAAEENAVGQARTLNQLAYVAWQTHRYAEASQQANQALTFLSPEDIEAAMSLSALGLVAIDQGDWVQAETLHRQALAIRTRYGDQRRMAWSLQNLGYALRGQGKYAEAIACYERAIAYLEQVHDPAHCDIAKMNLGIAHWLNGEFQAAVAIYHAVEHTFRQRHDQQNLAKVYNNLGLVYGSMQAWEQAEQMLLAGSALYGELGDTSLRLEAIDELRLVYLAQGKPDLANQCLATISAGLAGIEDSPSHAYLVQSISAHLAQCQQSREADSWRLPPASL